MSIHWTAFYEWGPWDLEIIYDLAKFTQTRFGPRSLDSKPGGVSKKDWLDDAQDIFGISIYCNKRKSRKFLTACLIGDSESFSLHFHN